MVNRKIWTILPLWAVEFCELARRMWQNSSQKTMGPSVQHDQPSLQWSWLIISPKMSDNTHVSVFHAPSCFTWCWVTVHHIGLTFARLSDDANNVGMLQLHHDAALLLKLGWELLIHHLFEAFDCHLLHLSIIIAVLALQHLTIVALNTANTHTCFHSFWIAWNSNPKKVTP